MAFCPLRPTGVTLPPLQFILETPPHILTIHLSCKRPLAFISGPQHMLPLLPEMSTALVPGILQVSVRLISSGTPVLVVLQHLRVLHTSVHMPLSDTVGLVLLACRRGPFPPGDASAAETLSLSAQSPAGSLLSVS